MKASAIDSSCASVPTTRASSLAAGLVDLEVAMGACAPRVDHALGNPLVIEMGDLLAQNEILQQRRSARACL